MLIDTSTFKTIQIKHLNTLYIYIYLYNLIAGNASTVGSMYMATFYVWRPIFIRHDQVILIWEVHVGGNVLSTHILWLWLSHQCPTSSRLAMCVTRLSSKFWFSVPGLLLQTAVAVYADPLNQLRHWFYYLLFLFSDLTLRPSF